MEPIWLVLAWFGLLLLFCAGGAYGFGIFVLANLMCLLLAPVGLAILLAVALILKYGWWVFLLVGVWMYYQNQKFNRQWEAYRRGPAPPAPPED